MAYKYREEIVGKRFLSVSGFAKLKVNKIAEWGWRSGVIRAASHRDNHCQDLQILVEYDDVEWQRREWLSPHRDSIFSFFLVEKGLSWSERPDPKHTSLFALEHHNNANNNHHHPRINGKPVRGSQAVACNVPWPALTFFPLVARAELPEDATPIEFMQDRRLEFVDYSKLKAFTQDWELSKSSAAWASAVRQWGEMQDGQSILLTTPSVLVGFRVEVYRSEGTTQWYTAVIVGYNESTKDLTVTDDTVLEEHNEDPCLVQMRLIGKGVVESIMRGEDVGMTPRRSRSSVGLTNALVMPRSGRRSRVRPGSAAQLQTTLRSHSLVSQQLEKEKSNVRNNRKRRISEGDKSESPESVLQSRQEDRENKGPLPGTKPGNRTPRNATTAVLEETNTASVAKLRQRRPQAVKPSSPVESALSQRPVRRKTRLETSNKLGPEDAADSSADADEQQQQPQRPLSRLQRKDRSTVSKASKTDEDDGDDKSNEDPLIKRLRSSLLADKAKKELKAEERFSRPRPEDIPKQRRPESRQQRQIKEEPIVKSEQEEEEDEDDSSESRERDREPEPPPDNKRLLSTVTSGEIKVKQEPKDETDSVIQPSGSSSSTSSTDVKPHRPNGEIRIAQRAEEVSRSGAGLKTGSESVSKEGASSSAGRPSSGELTKTTKEGGAALDRLSSLSSAGRSLLQQHHPQDAAEQERTRHSESPVILVERLNKPPPPGLQQQRHPSAAAAAAAQHHAYLAAAAHHHHQAAAAAAAAHHLLPLHHYPVKPSAAAAHHLLTQSLLEAQQREQQLHHHQQQHGVRVDEAESGPDAPAGPAARAYADSGSDSGVSSLGRSAGSGDERSGSRSSALSADDSSVTTARSTPNSAPPAGASTAAPARIWHVQSVQHTSLLMAHHQAAAGAPPGGVPPPGVAYQTGPGPGPPPPHHPALGAAQDILWRPPSARFLPLPHGIPQQPSLGEVLERDRHERILRERRDAEVRESREREAKLDRERMEKQRAAEQAVHKHFEESLRLAQQKRNMQTAPMAWNPGFLSLAPPTSRASSANNGSAVPGNGTNSSQQHHHSSPSPVSNQSQSQQQQQQQQSTTSSQQQRERERERERDRDRSVEHAKAVEREEQLAATHQRDQHQEAAAAAEYAAAHQSLAYLRAAAAAAAVQPQNAQQVSRPSSVPGKVEYPPPAHSRSTKSTSSASASTGSNSNGGTPNRHDKRDQQQPLPKAEPNVSLFGYSGYGQPGSGFAHDAAVKQMQQSSKSSVSKDLRDQQQSHSLPNPPPLLSDHKSSVIVKNEGSSREQKQPAHSPSPKMMSYLNVQPVQVTGSQHKSAYEGRSPTQSPHGPSHHHQQQQLLGSSPQPVHHASSRPGSAHLQHGPPGGVNRHSPHAPTSSGPPTSSSASSQQQHIVSQLPHPSPPEPRYLSRPDPQMGYPPHPAKSPYAPYPHPHHSHQTSASPTSHYAAPAVSKPKVSSPAPPHIYGKPNSGLLSGAPGAGIMTGTPVCRASDSMSSQSSTSSPSSIAGASVPLPLTSKASAASPFQSIGHHTVAPGSHFAAHPHPPPAHSSRSPYDSRGYNSPLGAASKLPPPPLHSNPGIGKLPPPMHILPPGAALAPIARPPPSIAHPVAHLQPAQPQSQLGSSVSSVQTQPLDLGVERSGSPKRKACTPQGTCLDPNQQPVSLELIKKRRLEDTISPPHMQQQPVVTTAHNAIGSPMMSRVSEPSPLIASAATSINTVVNSALLTQPNSQSQMNSASVSPAPRTASGDGSLRPSSAGSVGSLPPMSSSSASANQFGSSSTVTTAVTSTTPVPSPAPSTVASPAPTSAPGTPAKAEPVGNDKAVAGSPAPPPRPPSSTSYPVHKLKKAWLQRHSGEDGTEDTTGVVGSGSCVTLPLNIAGNKQTNGNAGKDKDGNNSTSSTTSTATSVSSSSTTTSTTSLPSAVNSIHNIGSMAVNSINKSKVAMKARKTPVKESVNGHATSAAGAQNNSESLHEDSSNSEPERKAPPKRKPPKVKRKKGATWKQQTVQDQQRQKKQKQVKGGAAIGSDSSNESEAGSVSDSSEQRFPARPIMQISAIDTFQTSGNGNKKVPKKRGRKPRTTKDIKTKEEEEEEEDYQPHQKKKRLDSKTGGGSNKNKKRKTNRISTMEDKPEKEKLMKTLQSWIQDDLCHRYSCGRLSKCRECRLTPNQRDKMSPVRSVTVFCRFYAFRRMQYTKSGSLIMAGFNDPYVDADENDIQLWLPGKDNRFIKRDKYTEETQKDSKKDWDKGEFHIELAYQIIRQVGDQFCDLIHQEKKVVEEHLARVDKDSKDQSLIWKRVVKEVREMCDLCDTTLFNYHWTCGKCGFVVCIDCYEARKNESLVWTENSKGRDKYGWLLCANRQTHAVEQLLLTQIIPADCLVQIDRLLHESRNEWGIPKHCSCKSLPTKQPNEYLVNLIKGDLVSIMNGNGDVVVKKEKSCSSPCESGPTNGEEKNSLDWLADVALQNQDKNDSDSDSDSDEDQDGNHSTLRELLIRPSHKANGNTSNPNSPEDINSTAASNSPANNSSNNPNKMGKKTKMDTLNEVISSVIEHSVKKEDESGRDGEKPRELKHFVRRYKCPQRGRDPLPMRIMTFTESSSLYPKVSHSWLCDGKLLRLHEPHDNENYRIFQDQWKRGQPVLVSGVHRHLDKDLWHPDSFSNDFGVQKNDLINCMTGNTVPKQPMWKFWDGFEHPSKRLKDDQGNAMLLKLKDWPSKGDFADILPTRFADLMKCVPLSEYTHRYGRLNLTSRLPDTFIKPDLGPKMYNAYGSALYPDKGTTNLHLDVSDAVNVMVYVGISKDGDREKHIEEALKAIDQAGCDLLTRRRVRELGEIPGALWHIYHARDADKIRDMLNAVALEKGARLEPHHDPIHDQSFYLDKPLRERLYRDYGVEGYAIVQCLGDAVFVPAGAPHQVRNLHNCIKVAEDFVSPENISHCFSLTQEFRALSDTHTNHEDKLQIKNIIYHAVKDSLTALDTFKDELLSRVKTEKSSSVTALTSTSFDSKSKIKVEKSDGT